MVRGKLLSSPPLIGVYEMNHKILGTNYSNADENFMVNSCLPTGRHLAKNKIKNYR